MSVLLDTSAVLAVLWGEPGAQRVAAVLPGASISAANLAELTAKLYDRGAGPREVAETIDVLALQVAPVTAAIARDSGAMRGETRRAGLSLGDRLCLAQARATGAVVLTADRAWAALDLGIDVEVIR